jgi:methylmalonyl-CoA mutase C-terminal domain/subunit
MITRKDFMVTGSHPIRVLVAKPGLDGHDRGAKVIARALRDAGMEVIYTGIRQTPQMIVQAAAQEDVQVLGLSILSGAHLELLTEIIRLLKEQEMEDVMVVLGGIIPEQDRASLSAMGVKGIFGPGSSTHSIVEFIQQGIRQTSPE